MASEVTTARESTVNPINATGMASNPFSKVGTTKVGDYEIEVRNNVSQNRNGRGLNLNSSTYTEIRQNGRVVAWNSTLPGGEKRRNEWIAEQRRKFKI